jgi:hypothetical protein
MKKYIFAGMFILLATSFALQQAALAEETDTVDISDTSSCTVLTKGMSLGSRDSRTNGEVTDLQAFLQQGGYLAVDPTGYFGLMTSRAVQTFQKANGITPNAQVGPITRGKIKALSCQTNVTTSVVPATSAPVVSVPKTGSVTAVIPASADDKFVQGQPSVRLADIIFTGKGTVTAIELQRIGTSADSALTNISLYDNGTRITDGSSASVGGYIYFYAPAGLFSLNSLRMISVGADLATSTAGQTIGVKLNSVTVGGTIYRFSNVTGTILPIMYPTVPVGTSTLVDPSVQIGGTTTQTTSTFGRYEAYLNGSLFITTPSIVLPEALTNCKTNAANNSTKSIRCTWNGIEIYSSPASVVTPPVVVNTSGPGVNAMSCSKPSLFGLTQMQEACYGIWDYGNEFGGDSDMCPPAGVAQLPTTGCVVKTTACQSGQAIATRMVNPISMSLSSSDLETFARNLKSTKEAVRAQIPALWVYTCKESSSTVTTLANPTLSSASPVGRTVAGSSLMNIATFTLRTVETGTTATVRELRFTTTGKDAIESVTVGGITVPVVSNTATVAGLSLTANTAGVDVPVTVKFAGFQNSTSGGSLTQSVPAVSVTLSRVDAVTGSGVVISNTTAVSSKVMSLVGSYPALEMYSDTAHTFELGDENLIASFSVASMNEGKIALSSLALTSSTSGIINPIFSNVRVDMNGDPLSVVASISGGNATISFPGSLQVIPGQLVKFKVYARVSGTLVTGISPVLSTRFTSPSSFVWTDSLGITKFTGENLYNFPTNAFVLRSASN